MIGRLNHVAIAVPDLKSAARLYSEVLGGIVSERQDLPEHGVGIVFVTLDNSKIELITPLDEQSGVATFLQRNPGGGMHHVCYEVADLQATRDILSARGIRVLGEPKIGAHGLPVLFLHPKDCGGTLIELEQIPPGASAVG